MLDPVTTLNILAMLEKEMGEYEFRKVSELILGYWRWRTNGQETGSELKEMSEV